MRGTGRLDVDRQERLNTAMVDYESALKRRDETAAAMADEKIEAVLAEARSAREPGAEAASNVGQTPAEPPVPVPSFDGGVRRPVTRRREPLTMGQTIRAELASRDEIRQRHQDHVRAWDRAARR